MADTQDKAALVAAAFSQAAPIYDSFPLFALAGRRLADLAGVTPGQRVLDVATGTGAVLFPLAEMVGPQGSVTGIDVAPPMVERTAAAIAARGLAGVRVVVMDAAKLDFEDGAFDVVTCGFALWFIPQLDRALGEIQRVLRPQGRLAVSTWGPRNQLAKRYNDLAQALGGAGPALDSHTLTSAEVVRDALTGAGFRVTHASEETVTAQFADEDDWWAHRPALPRRREERLAPEARVRFKQQILAELREIREPDGTVRESWTAVFAVAARG